MVSVNGETLWLKMSLVRNLLSQYRYILLLLLIMAVSFGFYVPKYGLIYDGGLYASLGYSLQRHGSYTFNGAPGDVPPSYSLLLAISILLMGEKGIFTVTPLFSALFICTVFLLFKREFDEGLAFLGALLVLFSPPIFFYAIQVVRDLPLMAFVVLSYLLYMNLENGKSTLIEVLLGASIALAFLTKYAAVVYLLPIFIHAAAKRKNPIISLVTSLVVLLPWMAWSYANHGTFLVSHSSYLTKELGRDVGRFFTFLLPRLVIWSFPPMFLLSLPGFAEKVREETLNPLALLLISTLVIGVVWPEKDIRYVLFALVLVVYFVLIFLSRFKKSQVLLFLLIVLVFQSYSSFLLVEANTYQNILFEDAGHWLRDNTPEDARILTQSHRQVNYFSHRMTFQPPKEVERVERFISYYNTTYAVVDTYEKVTPAYAYTYFDRYELAKTFRRGEDEIRIYNLSRQSGITVILSFDFEVPEGAKNIPRILRILKEHNANATFFVTGAVAKDYPEVVRKIKEEGYEVGSHGHYHEFPIFEEDDAELFAKEFNTSFEYVWERSVKSEKSFEDILGMAREEIKNATGAYPSSYRSPILTPSITKDMRYIDVVEKAGFTIDSSLLRRYIEDGMVEQAKDITIVPASFSDAEFSNVGFVMGLAREHSTKEEPLVVVLHLWKFSKEEHTNNFKAFLGEIEKRYTYVEYKSMEGYVADKKG